MKQRRYWWFHRLNPPSNKIMRSHIDYPFYLAVNVYVSNNTLYISEPNTSSLRPYDLNGKIPPLKQIFIPFYVPTSSSPQIEHPHQHHKVTYPMICICKDLGLANANLHRPPHPLDEKAPPKMQKMLTISPMKPSHQQSKKDPQKLCTCKYPPWSNCNY